MQTNTAAASAPEYQPLQTTREERGREIAARGGIRKIGARFAVPSQSPGAEAPTYVVDLVDETCTCADYETRRLRCKHQEAVLFWLAWEGTVSDGGSVAPPKRKTYRQPWSAYNEAQTTEKARIEQLLKSLCEGIEQPARKPGPGRNPVPLRDAVFSATMKVYTGMSGRRASTDIRNCAERGHIADAPHYNTVFRCMESEATTAILVRLVEESAAPLAEIENLAGQFAQDSTGFSTVTYDRWFDQKHGKLPREVFVAWVNAIGGSVRAAALLNVSRSYVDMLRAGSRRPGLRAAHAIERVTGIAMQAWVDEAAE